MVPFMNTQSNIVEILDTWNFWTSDAGGSVSVHCFGAYFGLAVSYSLKRKRKTTTTTLCTSRYTSDIFAMIGTLFLWIYWPSFNAVGLSGDQQHLAIINTYLSLASCCVTTFIVSPFFTSDEKFDMVHIQNATLAGGVAIGGAANLLVQPYGAVAIGFLAAVLSVYGYSKITPWFNIHWNIIDTCGVHNLHGMPGIFGGLIAAFMTALATEDEYHGNLYAIFPARIPDGNLNFTSGNGNIEVYQNRSAVEQAGFQLLSLLVTILIATVSGAITGTSSASATPKLLSPLCYTRKGNFSFSLCILSKCLPLFSTKHTYFA
ncbi:hypothetical protein WA026_006165 [Henosepilachna vigintioctopunctata]|uniref:Ammonium transporter AmtB-like domain-containing protein n=1 Tax=Henosepilachna vigintioctopunctata TaxID=420089 RepID=A0AAW1TJN7_9CUCU